MKFHIRDRILGAIRKKPFIVRTNIPELGHNCKELTQLFFIHMSEIFAHLALQVERKEKVHLGERAKGQSIHKNPKRNIVIGVLLVCYVGVLRCQSQLLQFMHQSVNALLMFPHVVIVRFQKICALCFSVFLRKIIGKQRTDVSLNVQKIMKKQLSQGFVKLIQRHKFFKSRSILVNLLRRKAKKMLVPTDKRIIANLLQFTKSSSFVCNYNVFFISQLDKLLFIRQKRLRHFSVLIKHSIKKGGSYC